MNQDMEIDQEESYTALANEAIILSLSWLSSARDLASASCTNKTILAAAREPHLWKPILEELENSIRLHDTVRPLQLDDPEQWWPSPGEILIMRIPPRIHGEHVNFDTFLPHPRDRVARRYPEPLMLLQRRGPVVGCGLNKDTGELEDPFVLSRNSFDRVWLPRTFPCECSACRVTLNSSKEMIEHCTRYEHISNSKPENERVPPEWVDPRHDDAYANLGNFEKAKVLGEYRNKVYNFLRAPMDQDDLEFMRDLLDSIRENILIFYNDFAERMEVDLDEALAGCTLERLMKIFVEDYAIAGFHKYGMSGFGLDVVLRGWASLELNGGDYVIICSKLSGVDCNYRYIEGHAVRYW